MSAEVKLPSYYAELAKRNPVILAFQRDTSSFKTLMRRVSSSPAQNNSGYAKGIKVLVEIGRKYKHRVPSKLYQEHMLQIADFLFGIKLYQLALWQGYSLHLQSFTSVNITDITDVEHFMACFFPEGFDMDHNILLMKFRALQGCAICIFELEKKQRVLSHKGLTKLLQILNSIRIMMQACQQHESLCCQIYNGSLCIYNICRYLMTMNCSAQALEYLLWASVSVELSIPLMTAQYVDWIVTLYCSVCYCYYDNKAVANSEEFARRALGKINNLANLEEQSGGPATRETQRAYREASIKLAAMTLKWTLRKNRKQSKPISRAKIKSSLQDIPNVPWPRTSTEHVLMSLFDSSAAQFLGILEALWDSTIGPLQTFELYEPVMQEVVLELLSAGISILSGEEQQNDHWCLSRSMLTSTSTQMELAMTGQNKVSVMSAVKFIKLLFQYKQLDVFAAFTRQMLQILPDVQGQLFRKAELELALLNSFNSFQSARQKSGSSKTEELVSLVETLQKSVCGSVPLQLDVDLVLDIVLFLWNEIKAQMQKTQLQHPKSEHFPEEMEHYQKWVRCLYVLHDVAIVCDLSAVDCIMMAEITHRLAVVLESAVEHNQHISCLEASEETSDHVKPSSLSVLEGSSTKLLQKLCNVLKKGLEAVAKGRIALMSQDCSAITDAAYIQKFRSSFPSTSSLPSLLSSEEENGNSGLSKRGKMEPSEDSHHKTCCQSQSTHRTMLALDLHMKLIICYHRATLKLLQLNPAVTEHELLNRINKNKVSKAIFLIEKALLLHNSTEPRHNNKCRALLEEASAMILKAGIEERRLYISATCTSNTTTVENKNRRMKEEKQKPPPPPVLVSRTDNSLAFVPAHYSMEKQVCWYQIFGHAAEGINQKVRLGDCSLLGTGNLVPVSSGLCVLRVEGLEHNQMYVFAVAAYDAQGDLLGNTIGETTSPVLASMPLSLLTTWVHLAQVAFQMGQYAVAKVASRELWSHYTNSSEGFHYTEKSLAKTRLRVQTLQNSSSLLCKLFLTSIFIETEINIQQGSLYCDTFGDSGPFIWQQESRMAECDRVLVAMDLALWLNDSSAAVQAVVYCYGLLAPLIFHQVIYEPMVQVLIKCLIVLEESLIALKQKWTGNTSEALLHMIACITYYLSKALRVLKHYQMASMVIDCGQKLLREVYNDQLHFSRLTDCSPEVMKLSLQLKALHMKTRITHEAAPTTDSEISHLHELSDCADAAMLYDRIISSSLKSAYEDVIKHRHEAYFIEIAAVLLQRTMEENHPELVKKWGKKILGFVSRRVEEMGFSVKCLADSSQSDLRNAVQPQNEASKTKVQKPAETPQKITSYDDTRMTSQQRKPHSLHQEIQTCRKKKAQKKLLKLMSSTVHRHKKRVQQRKLCAEERVWRSHINYSIAQSHLAMLHKHLHQLYGETLQHRYSDLSPLWFSLASSGVLVQRTNSKQQQSPDCEASETDFLHTGVDSVSALHRDEEKEDVRLDDFISAESDVMDVAEEDFSETVTQQSKKNRSTTASILRSLNKAALHLRRAMVLAHRGSHWTTLHRVCQTVWDQSCAITDLFERGTQLEPLCSISTDQLHTTFTPLLVLATDLLMDMLNRLGLWSLYDSESAKEELEFSLHFSVPLDYSIMVDLRWVRTLVLHTLQRLHYSGKWESLAHFALLFNSYTREHYALIVTPLLVHAQRKLLERISSFGGPAVPQPHHLKTQKAIGTEITCRNYATSQLLSGWTPYPAEQRTIPTKSPLSNPTSLDTAEHQESSMSLVCVPVDVEDTLQCYRQALERKPYCLQIFQHSRLLLLLLLAHTQSNFTFQFCKGISASHSSGGLEFNPIIISTPKTQPCELTEEDYSNPNAVYSLSSRCDNVPTVSMAYSACIKYLLANQHDSLGVQALHDMGNLQYCLGNKRKAHSNWCKAVDCALKSSNVLEKWDGVSFGSDSFHQTVKICGIWGCLQAAGITAKIAQYILISDTNQRTKCCLLSAYLFKCVLCCSLAQPQSDLQYASYRIGDELLPEVDLFSEPHRVHLGTTIANLNFICHWLFSTGYYITLLPILALYQHLVGTVCRDLQRSVESKILKVLVLTELSLFTQAVKEILELTQGTDIPLAHGHNICKDDLPPMRRFCSSKSLQDNIEALDDLVNCNFAPDVQSLYGSTLCQRCNLARVKLILALCSTVHGIPMPGTPVKQSVPEKDEEKKPGNEPTLLDFDCLQEKLIPENIKFLLLEGASSLLNCISRQLTSQSCGEFEALELAIEFSLLKANLYMQQGNTALSVDMAVSSLKLLQTSPVIVKTSIPDSEKPESQHSCSMSRRDQGCIFSYSEPQHPGGDNPRDVEASERIGVALWLRFRLALLRSLAAQTSGTNYKEGAVSALHETLAECASWGDPDIQALFMVEGAALEAQRGNTEDSMSLLQEAVSLLCGRRYMPPGSCVTLAEATLLLSDLRGAPSIKLLKFTQKLLQKQLQIFGQSVMLEDKMCFPVPEPMNIYLPYRNLLAKTTAAIDKIQASINMEKPVSN
ncbi:cilia- and flagella-associated protein 54-like [Thalassophryne amazonica]|uniref:cilia- and flagella-associated protein 54-like n=1 Tax=Thalassophryne amazonica TaxID=390379 RepID=UPI0014709217|nr:cilia- and flagella-associated protein 54-like [Thalassophryne amazonica]